MIGRVYEVYVSGQPVGLVGSTMRTLEVRRKAGYTKRFGSTVELRLIREVACPNGYDKEGFTIRLRAAEAFDIVRKNTYAPNGLNKLSPLVQILNHVESEIGRLGGNIRGPQNRERMREIGRDPQYKTAKSRGGKTRGQQAKDSGQIQELGRRTGPINQRNISPEERRLNGRKGGLMLAASGQLGRNNTYESCKRGWEAGIGKLSLEQNRENGKKAAAAMLAKNPKGNGPQVCCLRWNIQRGKPCVCGKHLEAA